MYENQCIHYRTNRAVCSRCAVAESCDRGFGLTLQPLFFGVSRYGNIRRLSERQMAYHVRSHINLHGQEELQEPVFEYPEQAEQYAQAIRTEISLADLAGFINPED